MHLSKAGGANFADDLGAHAELGPSAGYKSCGGLHSMSVNIGNGTSNRIVCDCSKYLYTKKLPGCNFYACEGSYTCNLRLLHDRLAPQATVRSLMLVREPEALLVSMYAHCQQDGADGQRRHHYPKISFGDWVALWSEGRSVDAFRYCGYYAENAQTRYLADTHVCSAPHTIRTLVNESDSRQRPPMTQQAIAQALSVVDTAHLVGVTAAYKASLCLALLRGPVGLSTAALAQKGCACDPATAAHRRHRLQTSRSHGTSHGTHTSLIGIDGLTRTRIRTLTWLDELLYARALARLERDLEALGWQCLL